MVGKVWPLKRLGKKYRHLGMNAMLFFNKVLLTLSGGDQSSDRFGLARVPL
jgi:hypothetical protein